MAQLIDDDVVERLAIVGSAAECAHKIDARFGEFASRVCCYFPGYAISDTRIAALVDALHHL